MVNITTAKIRFAEYVVMTGGEYQKLLDKHGPAATLQMIERLNSYKLASGKQYVSDYQAIHSWVAKEHEIRW